MQATLGSENRLQSHPTQDILECLSLASVPLSEALISQQVPWIPDIPFILADMVSTGDLTSHLVQIPPQPSHNAQNVSPNFITVFVPSLDLRPLSPHQIAYESQETNMRDVIDTLHQTLAQKGLDFVPHGCLPVVTLESIESELSSLKSLRSKYVDRLAQLNEALSLSQSSNTANEENNDFQATNFNLSHDRLVEHRKTKERLRSELKEMIQVLSGVLAEHKNVSIFDIISEYKNL